MSRPKTSSFNKRPDKRPASNAMRNAKARAKMSACQRAVGLTEAEIVAWHAEQRAGVWAHRGDAAA